MDTIHTLIKHLQHRWLFLVVSAGAIGLLVVADRLGSVALAAAGAVAAFMAGAEFESQNLCAECAAPMVVTDAEIPEHYPTA